MTDMMLARLGTQADMRQQAVNIATLQMIQDSCFWSPEKHRHSECRRAAYEITGHEPDSGWLADGELKEVIQNGRFDFAMKFYCRGAQYVCGSCGSLVPNGMKGCPECGQAIEEQAGVLAIPEWQTRLTLKTMEVAVNTALQVDQLITHNIHRTMRLLALRNLLNQSDRDSWKIRANELREQVLDAWPDGLKPDKDSWQFRFCRASAVFWIVGWPMLEDHFTLEEVDKLFNVRLIKAVSVSAAKWVDAEADPGSYGRIVRGIIDASDLDKEKAILGLSPADLVAASGKDAAKEKVLVLHPPELLMRGTLFNVPSGAWLAIPISEPEFEILESRFGVPELDYADLIARLEKEGDSK